MAISKHGTRRAYIGLGCRCDICVSAVPHRTLNGYTNWRCRCPDCRFVMADYRGLLRKSYATSPPDDIPHGTLNGYDNYSCRCTKCRAANGDRSAVNAAVRRARQRRVAAGGA